MNQHCKIVWGDQKKMASYKSKKDISEELNRLFSWPQIYKLQNFQINKYLLF